MFLESTMLHYMVTLRSTVTIAALAPIRQKRRSSTRRIAVGERKPGGSPAPSGPLKAWVHDELGLDDYLTVTPSELECTRAGLPAGRDGDLRPRIGLTAPGLVEVDSPIADLERTNLGAVLAFG